MTMTKEVTYRFTSHELNDMIRAALKSKGIEVESFYINIGNDPEYQGYGTSPIVTGLVANVKETIKQTKTNT